MRYETYCQYYELIGNEVEYLVGKVVLSEEWNEGKESYNGYGMKLHSCKIEIHSTWSIVNYIHEKQRIFDLLVILII